MKIKKVLLPLAMATIIGTLGLTSCRRENTQDDQSTTTEPEQSKVYAPSELSVNKFKATTVFNLGEKFSSDGLVVTLVFSNYSKRVLETSEYVVDSSSFDSSKCGEYEIHVVYTDANKVRVTDSYTVTVKSIAEEATPHVLGIEASITTVAYKANAAFSSEGLKVTAYYSDGTNKDVTSQCTTDNSLIDMTKMGVYQFKVNYKEKYTKDGKEETKSCDTFVLVTVDATLAAIKFVSGTTTVEQDTVGPDGTMTSLDTSDWVVEGTFRDDNYDDLTSSVDVSKVTVTGFNAGIAGDQTVTLSYKHGNVIKECTTTVHVNAIAEPDYTFNASDLSASLPDTLTAETEIDSIISGGNKCQIKSESSAKTYGTMSFTKRIQTNGAGKADSANYIKFTLDKDATVAIIGRSSGDAKPVTAAGFYDANNALVGTSYAYTTAISKYKYELKAGTYYFYDPAYAVQVYGIQIWYK